MTFVESATLNYSDVFYSFFTKNDSICHNKANSGFQTHRSFNFLFPAFVWYCFN